MRELATAGRLQVSGAGRFVEYQPLSIVQVELPTVPADQLPKFQLREGGQVAVWPNGKVIPVILG
jgi:hypothetical protein